ncbi:hypothetical protein D3C85_880100 [compost metagenome]
MALTPVQQVRLFIGDTPTSPFYQLFTDEEIQTFIDMSGGDVMQAARMGAISASFQLAGWTTRERTGDIEVWSSLSTQYLKALDNLIKDPSFKSLPTGLHPYAAGISWEDVCNNMSNPDNVQPKLTNIHICDWDELFCGNGSSRFSGC